MTYTVDRLNTVEFFDGTDRNEHTSVDIGFQPLLEREVQIRRLLPHAAGNPRLRSQFMREIRTLAGCSHQSLVRVYDAGLEDDLPYAVMEHLVGIGIQQRLDQLTDRKARMPLVEVQHIAGSVLDAIIVARQHGMSITMLAPEGILLSSDGRVVLTDLSPSLPENPLTASLPLLAYAAPEHFAGGLIDERSAVYSLGALLFHLLTGRLPFEGSSLGVITQKQNNRSVPDFVDVATTSSQPPKNMAALIHRAMQREIHDRHNNLLEFRADLEAAFDQQPEPTPLTVRQAISPFVAEERLTECAVGETAPLVATVAAKGEETLGMRLAKAHAEVEASDEGSAQPAPMVEVAAQLATALESGAASNETVATIDIDPLMPGRDNPSLQAALPYTILVPMPGADNNDQGQGSDDQRTLEEETPAPGTLPRTGSVVAQAVINDAVMPVVRRVLMAGIALAAVATITIVQTFS